MVLKQKGFLVFALLFSVFLLVGVLAIFFLPKGQIVEHINHFYASENLDTFFAYITLLGLGFIFAIVIVLLGFYKIYHVFTGLIILILNGLFTFLFKQVLFKGMPRPTKFLDIESLNLIEGFTYHSSNSFPSGHTFTAFAMFTMASVIVNKKGWSTVFFILAFLIGFSRMYLLQHFFMDIYAGAILGFLCSTLVLYFGEKYDWENKIKFLKHSYIKKH